ncbi:MAG: MFS transporter [Nitriliruptorales bacterium]|nr:MFS transporter [Nitriliruptorales bacterium]
MSSAPAGDAVDPASRRRALVYLAGTRLSLVSVERFVFPFLPAIARGLDVSLTQAGLLLSARGVGGLTVPFTVAAGHRRQDARRLVSLALGLFVAGAMLVVVPGTYAVALLGFLILGAARPAFDVAAQGYLSDRTSYDRRGRVLAVLELMYAGALLVGAPVAGWLIATWDWRAPFVVGAVLAALAAGLSWRTLEGAPVAPQRNRQQRVSLDREATAMLVLAGLLLAAAELTFVVFGAWLEDVHGFGTIAIGVSVIALGVAELSGEVVTLTVADRVGKQRTFLAGCGLAVMATIALALTSGSLIGGFAAMAVALLAFEVAVVAAIPLASEIRPATRVRYLALFAGAMSSGRIVAAAVGPWLYENWGIVANAGVSALAFAVTAIGMRLYVDEP